MPEQGPRSLILDPVQKPGAAISDEHNGSTRQLVAISGKFVAPGFSCVKKTQTVVVRCRITCISIHEHLITSIQRILMLRKYIDKKLSAGFPKSISYFKKCPTLDFYEVGF